MDPNLMQVILHLVVFIHTSKAYLFGCDPYGRKLCPQLTNRCDGCHVCWLTPTLLEVGCQHFNLTTIPAYTFSSLELPDGLKGFYIYMVSSGISAIDDNAFDGIEREVVNLDLQYNQLTTMPRALEKLHNLETLLLIGNPIHTVTSSVTAGFGGSLTKFTISLFMMTSYPTALNNLYAVEKMELYDIPFDMSAASIFHGQTKLKSLLLKYPTNYNGHIIPPSVVNTHSLTSIDIYGSYPTCDCSLSYLKTWNVTNVHIGPRCLNLGMTIPQFIQGPLQKC